MVKRQPLPQGTCILKTIVKGLLVFSYFFLIACQHTANSPRLDLAAIAKHEKPLQAVTPKKEPVSRYGNPDKYSVKGKEYKVLKRLDNFEQSGIASWYGPNFHTKRTSSGEVYDMYALTAAHKLLPIPSYVEVTNIENNKSVVVKVNDRGPFHGDRIIDLSYAAAKSLNFLNKGTAQVKIKLLEAPSFQTLKWYLQLGAYQKSDNAKKLKMKITHILAKTPINIIKEQGKYLVSIGPIANQTAIEQLSQQLKDHGVSQFFSYLR